MRGRTQTGCKGRRCLFLKRRNILTLFHWNGGLALQFITKQPQKRDAIEAAAFPACLPVRCTQTGAEAKPYRLGGVLREKKAFLVATLKKETTTARFSSQCLSHRPLIIERLQLNSFSLNPHPALITIRVESKEKGLQR